MLHGQNTIVVAVVLLAISTTASSLRVLAQAPAPSATISVADIGTKVSLVGRLGQPLGKMMTIRGKWGYPDKYAKDYSLRFTVSHVNGKQLAKPVEFNIAQIDAASPNGKNAIPEYAQQKALDGVSWTLRAYETGHFDVVPEEYWTERGSGPHAVPYWTSHFTSELVGIVRHEPRIR